MSQAKGLLSKARDLDNRVLGTSDSKRGWWVNLFMGLNPYLVWFYVAAAGVLLILAALAIARGGDVATPSVNAGWLLLLAYVSRSLPKRWPSKP